MIDELRPALCSVASGFTAGSNMQPVLSRVVFGHNELIYNEGDRLDSWYEVVSGSVRACNLLSDGRRQVIEFYLPGDIFGFDDVGEVHGLATEVASDPKAVLIRHSRRRLDTQATHDPMLACRLRSFTLYRLAETRTRIITLGRLTAVERVLAFLTEMKDRLAPEHDAGGYRVLTIPIERKDIADYLGVTAETLCRCIQSLRRCGTIELVTPRQIKLLDEALLSTVPTPSRPVSMQMRTDYFKAA